LPSAAKSQALFSCHTILNFEFRISNEFLINEFLISKFEHSIKTRNSKFKINFFLVSLLILGYNKLMEIITRNKKANLEYEILEKFEAGLVLTGQEIKAIRAGRANLTGTFCRVDERGAWVLNMHIATVSEPERSRKLLLHKNEIISLGTKLQQKGFSLIPLTLYIKKGHAKLEIGLARGKKLYDHRDELRKRDIDLQASRELKNN